MGDIYAGYTAAKPFLLISLQILWLVGLPMLLLSTSLRMEPFYRCLKSLKITVDIISVH